MEATAQADLEQQKLNQAKQLLWDAIVNSNLHNIEVILKANFPINEPLNTLGMTALHFAAMNRNEQVILKILQYG